MKTGDGLYLSFHEAALIDYASMTLRIDAKKLLMTSALVASDINCYKVKRSLPFKTPWRTIQVSETAGGLIESNLILNLNDPNVLGDVLGWVKPTKYIGIWWDMHLGRKSWDLASGKHGATTAYAKELIDFASENKIGGLLVEGWNTGWEHWIGFPDREGVFDFVTPYPDYDLKEVARYGKEKGVNLIMHHETSAAPRTYEQQLDTAYSLMRSLDIHTVKTGYVGTIIPKGEYHHGQWMINHYQKVIETAARYHIAVDAHETIKDTGLRRTWPNFVARETFRGQEFNAWGPNNGNPPEHLAILPFTTMLAGPMDYTPGIFDLKLKPWKEHNQVNSTLAQQLALYVVILSPVQMAADLIKNYKGHPEFQFIRDVPVTWEQTKVLNGEIGDYVTIAREERGTGNWFIGSLTDENSRELEINLDFLKPGEKYLATIYADGEDADWDKNPTSYKIEKMKVNHTTSLKLKLAPGGGTAISIIKI
jgi:glucan 1,4-alpha-glucosidase